MGDKLHTLTDAGALAPDDLVYVVRETGGVWSSLRTTAGAIAALVPGGDGFPLDADGDAAGFRIINLDDPNDPQDAATRAFVLAAIPPAGVPYSGATGDVDLNQRGLLNVDRGDFVQRDAGGGTEEAGAAVGGFAQGYVSANATRLARVYAEHGAAVLGVAKASVYGSLLEQTAVDASALGAFAQGYSKDVGLIGAEAVGALAGGYAHGDATFGGAAVRAYGKGASARGYAGPGGAIKTPGYGATAFGYAKNAEIQAPGKGAVAFGYAKGYAAGYGITAGQGLAVGNVYGGGLVYSSGKGSIAHGYTAGLLDSAGSTQIYSGGHGSFAGGFAGGFAEGDDASVINAGGAGSFAHGRAKGAGHIEAGDVGAFAFGYAKDNHDVIAGYKGSMAVGYAATADVSAGAIEAFQFGQGANGIARSLRVGSGIRLMGVVADAPAVLANGDIWLGADGNVRVRTGGVTKSMTAI